MSNERGTGPFVGPKEDDNDEGVSSSLLQKAWHGKLPAKVSLAAGESKSFTNTTPLYVNRPLAIPSLTVAATSTHPLFTMFS